MKKNDSSISNSLKNSVLIENAAFSKIPSYPSNSNAHNNKIKATLEIIKQEINNFISLVKPFDDFTYIISKVVLGVQLNQQSTMQQLQEHQNQQTQQTQPQYKQKFIPLAPAFETELEIWDEKNQFIDRTNLSLLTALDPNQFNVDNVIEIFSKWVGSSQNAEFVIEKIDSSALNKLIDKKFSRLFNFGFQLDNLPPGFYLQKIASTNRLVLLYDDKLEEKVLAARRLAKECKVNHPRNEYAFFTVTLNNLLSTEKLFYNYSPLDASAMLKRPDNTEGSTEIFLSLIEFSRNQLEQSEHLSIEDNHRLLQFLVTHTDKKLKQLIPLLSLEDSNVSMAIQQWFTVIYLANKYLQENNFLIWLEKIIEPMDNWSDLLEPNDIKALLDSIFYCKSNNIIEQAWWRLIEAHGDAVGSFRYSQLWEAFYELLQYIENCNIPLELNSMVDYLTSVVNNSTSSFNGLIFLERLVYVLKTVSVRPDGHEVQQRILENISRIDWGYNGFYYACRFCHVTNWYPELRLTNLTTTDLSEEPTYKVKWKKDAQITDYTTHMYRFVVQNLNYSASQFKEFLQLTAVFDLSDRNSNTVEKVYPIIILFMACLVCGKNSCNKLNVDQVKETFNKLLTYDTSLLTSISMAFVSDLFSNELYPGHFGLNNLDFTTIDKLFDYFSINLIPSEITMLKKPFINCFSRILTLNPKAIPESGLGSILSNFIDRVKSTNDFSSEEESDLPLLITHFPWLVLESSLDKSWFLSSDLFFEKKLNSNYRLVLSYRKIKAINFTESSYFPNSKEIYEAIRDRHVIDDLSSKGCLFPDNSIYRPLNQEEFKYALDCFDEYFKGYTHASNIDIWNNLLNYLAVNDGIHNPSMLIREIVEFLQSISNKDCHNEVNSVVGTISMAMNERKHKSYVSLPILLFWLKSLTWREKSKQYLYNIELLNTVLSVEEPTFISDNLANLGSTFPNQELTKHLPILANKEIKALIKPLIVDLYLKNKGDFAFIETIFSTADRMGFSLQWIQTFSEFIAIFLPIENGLEKDRWINFIETIHPSNFLPEEKTDQEIEALWTNNLIKLMNLFISAPVERKYLFDLLSLDPYVTCLLSLIVTEYDMINKSEEIKAIIIYFKHSFIQPDAIKFLNYWLLNTRPTLTQFSQIIEQFPKDHDGYKSQVKQVAALQYKDDGLINFLDNTLKHMIKVFEEMLVKDKRDYSLTESDEVNLVRVLNGIKCKDNRLDTSNYAHILLNLLYYCNLWAHKNSIEQLDLKQLQNMLTELFNSKQTSNVYLNEDTQEQFLENQFQTAQILVVMREFLLRKTGIWLNRTQMVVLLYALINNDESTIHQLATGEGKSFVTIILIAFSALSGNFVDMYSAKESLSLRDYYRFTAFLTALNIPNAYISAVINPELYSDLINKHCGVVTFSVIGNHCLFQLHEIWQGKLPLENIRNKRVAFFDEADHSLLDEKTLFNQVNAQNKLGLYEYDQWAYETIVEFYLKNHKKFERLSTDESSANIKQDIKLVVNHRILEELTALIYHNSTKAPALSRFMTNFMVKTGSRAGSDFEKIAVRNNILAKILTAVYTASTLVLNKDYCVYSTHLQVSEFNTITIRKIIVLNDNNVQEGAIFSDYVQQVLCILENRNANKRGEIANFFVPPVEMTSSSLTVDTALITNASLVNKIAYGYDKFSVPKTQGFLRYNKIEGVTATPGDLEERMRLYNDFGIRFITRFPRHQASKSTYLSPVFCLNFNMQIICIINSIEHFKEGPILIHCKDDSYVEKIFQAIINSNRLSADRVKSIYPDLNKFGKTEAEVLSTAGLSGRVTLSARFTRGSDILTEAEKGLLVIMTYFASARAAKQPRGRQGRKGQPGIALDIINFDEIKNLYLTYSADPYFNDESSAHRYIKNIEEQEREKLSKKIFKESLVLEEQNRFTDKEDAPNLKWSWAKQEAAKERYITCKTVFVCKSLLNKRLREFEAKKNNLIASITFDIAKILQANPDNLHELQNHISVLREAIEISWQRILNTESLNAEQAFGKFTQTVSELYQEFIEKHVENLPVTQAITRKLQLSVPAQIMQKRVVSRSVVRLYQAFYNFTTSQSSLELQFKSGHLPQDFEKVMKALYRVSLNASTAPSHQLIELLNTFAELKFISYERLAAFIRDEISYINPGQLNILVDLYRRKFQKFELGCPQSIKKRDHLLTLVLGILSYSENVNKTVILSFFNKLITIIEINFWNDFNGLLADSIIRVLGAATSQSKFSSLLEHLGSPQNLSFFIRLMVQQSSSIYFHFNMGSLSKFLNDEKNLDIDVDYFIPLLLLCFNKNYYIEDLLSQLEIDRRDKTDMLAKIYSLISRMPDNTLILANLAPIQALPKNIPLKLISDNQDQLSCLTEFGQLFNNFLHSRGLTDHYNSISSLERQMEEANFWVLQIKSASLDQALFYEYAQDYPHLSFEVLQMLHELFQENPVYTQRINLKSIFDAASGFSSEKLDKEQIIALSDVLLSENPAVKSEMKSITEFYPLHYNYQYTPPALVNFLKDKPELSIANLEQLVTNNCNSVGSFVQNELLTAFKMHCVVLNTYLSTQDMDREQLAPACFDMRTGYFFNVAKTYTAIENNVLQIIFEQFHQKYCEIIELDSLVEDFESNRKANALQQLKADLVKVLRITNTLYSYPALFKPECYLDPNNIFSNDIKWHRIEALIRITLNTLVSKNAADFASTNSNIFEELHSAPHDFYQIVVTQVSSYFINEELSPQELMEFYNFLIKISSIKALFSDNESSVSYRHYIPLITKKFETFITGKYRASAQLRMSFNNLSVWLDLLFSQGMPIVYNQIHDSITQFILIDRKIEEKNIERCVAIYQVVKNSENNTFINNMKTIWQEFIYPQSGDWVSRLELINTFTTHFRESAKDGNCLENYLMYFPEVIKFYCTDHGVWIKSETIEQNIIPQFIKLCQYRNQAFLINDFLPASSINPNNEVNQSKLERISKWMDYCDKEQIKRGAAFNERVLTELYRYFRNTPYLTPQSDPSIPEIIKIYSLDKFPENVDNPDTLAEHLYYKLQPLDGNRICNRPDRDLDFSENHIFDRIISLKVPEAVKCLTMLCRLLRCEGIEDVVPQFPTFDEKKHTEEQLEKLNSSFFSRHTIFSCQKPMNTKYLGQSRTLDTPSKKLWMFTHLLCTTNFLRVIKTFDSLENWFWYNELVRHNINLFRNLLELIGEPSIYLDGKESLERFHNLLEMETKTPVISETVKDKFLKLYDKKNPFLNDILSNIAPVTSQSSYRR